MEFRLFRSSAIFLGALLISVMAGSAQCAGAVAWRIPLPDTLVFTSVITVKGHLSSAVSDDLHALIKQPGSAERAVREEVELLGGGLFSFTADLIPGKNDIILAGEVMSVYYQLDKSARPIEAEGFKVPQPAHGDLDCIACHTVSDGALALNNGMPELCEECHTVGIETLRKVAIDSEHKTNITPFCVGCHTPHVTFEPLLMKRKGDACTSCHKELAGLSGHEDRVSQPCALCHDPHQSSFDSMLIGGDIEKICKDCHREVARPVKARSVHSPLRREPCQTCHLVHDEGLGKLLSEDAPELCDRCHEGPGLVLHPDKLGVCNDCHSPHASPLAGLIREGADAPCRQCHEELPRGELHAKGAGKGCFQCHNPHSVFDEQPVSETCGTCHRRNDEGFDFYHSKLPMTELIQCLYCHQLHGPGVKRGKLYGKPHYPIKGGGCEVCHDQEDGEISMRYEGSQNCVRCHGDTVGSSATMEAEKVHAPITQEDCTACHNPHVRDYEKMLWDEPEKMCHWCHGIVMNMGEYTHGALEGNDCRVCHQPHFSEDRPLLKKKQPELCLGCHPKILDRGYEEDPMLHGAIRTGRCGGCHSPHTSDDPKLIRDTRDRICTRCHAGVLADKDGTPWSHLHGPVAAGKCTPCHELSHRHSEKADDLFLSAYPPEKICSECHEVTDAHIPERDKVRMGRIDNGCLGCHSPHGAGNGLMLRRMY
jgi:predicted CXXCH cytochrome family protein